ncbi:hypothetical protein [Enterococcus sp. LJL90]
MAAKLRLHESSAVRILPSDNGAKLEANQEYGVMDFEDKAILIISKINKRFYQLTKKKNRIN